MDTFFRALVLKDGLRHEHKTNPYETKLTKYFYSYRNQSVSKSEIDSPFFPCSTVQCTPYHVMRLELGCTQQVRRQHNVVYAFCNWILSAICRPWNTLQFISSIKVSRKLKSHKNDRYSKIYRK